MMIRAAIVGLVISVVGCKSGEHEVPPLASATTVLPPVAAPIASAVAAGRVYPLDVSVGELLSEYKDNEVRADGKFKGKLIETHGKVGDIKKDITGGIYVTIGTGGQFEMPVVQCFVAAGQEEEAAKLSKGQVITVRGKVDGLMMNVIVKSCVINPMAQVCRRVIAAVNGHECSISEETGDANGLIIREDGKGSDAAGALFCAVSTLTTPAREAYEFKLEKLTKSNPTRSVFGAKASLCYGIFWQSSAKKEGPLDIDVQRKIQQVLDAE
jgi:putative nucleic acid binding protein